MERLVRGATIVVVTLAASSGAQAQDPTSLEEPTDAGALNSSDYGPSNVEAGFFGGGFISNYYNQFYDDSIYSPNHVAGAKNRPQMDMLSPELGARVAVFPGAEWWGIEGELSTILSGTKQTGNSVQIYGLGVQGIAQAKWGRITPYAGFGISLRYTSSSDMVLGSDTDFPLHLSGGVRFWLTRAVALRAEVRWLRGPAQGHTSDPSMNHYTLGANYGEFSLGLSFNPKAPVEHHVRHVEVDPDPDHDGVLGEADKCPKEAGPAENQGCPDKDGDGDGIVDRLDKCPSESGPKENQGCPDKDSDGDGIVDRLDKCPNEPEDKDGFQDDDGCPDLDNDNDGVVDAKDKCPNEAGPIENAGCPDKDRDGDGIVDRLDNCPDEKGTEKNHGCKAPQLVSIEKDHLLIVGQINFVTGSAAINAGSRKLLDNVAAVMKAHPEFQKVKVEGHTDNVGAADFNQTLSEKRAGAIVDYLVKKGVAPERLEAIGHGASQPIDDNGTAKGRQQNRRVEFNIVYQ